MTGSPLPDGFGVYVHWPYCVSKCPYCDFNSHAVTPENEETWRMAYQAEIGRAAELAGGRTITSVFFGGGTPSLMSAGLVGFVIDTLARHWAFAPDVEITLEANPTTVESEKFKGFRAAGVNRVSLGVQSLRDGSLKDLGRAHGVNEALKAIDLARTTFERFSFDLIYARNDQTLAQWEDELTQALALAGDHLSLYQLTIEPGTDFQRSGRTAMDDDLAADFFELTRDITQAHGLPAYEISNHSRPGQECRHNLVYWRGQDYLGIGPGAHGRLTLDGHTTAYHQRYDPALWLRDALDGDSATVKERVLSDPERLDELVLMGLRLGEGINRAHFKSLCGYDLGDVLDPEGLAGLVENDYVISDSHGLRTTATGQLLLNTLLASLRP